MKSLTNYTIFGKFKFDSSNAEFGMNFCSQWPDSADRYCLMRKSDGSLKLYHYTDMHDSSLMAALDTAGTENDLPSQAGEWYNYKISLLPDESSIEVKCWLENGEISEPEDAGISDSIRASLTSGLAGFSTQSGSGYRYWSSFKVLSNESDSAQYMASETFEADTIVDIAPYVPENWTEVTFQYRLGT
ncbi:MAG: hypothetical protein GF401_10700, partial [Chitinivibrionales bacterium]|nr:hypothetical protein [Chitinivibrionales bacterium]